MLNVVSLNTVLVKQYLKDKVSGEQETFLSLKV